MFVFLEKYIVIKAILELISVFLAVLSESAEESSNQCLISCYLETSGFMNYSNLSVFKSLCLSFIWKNTSNTLVIMASQARLIG